MFRFTIRDLLWLMVVVGLSCALVLSAYNAALWRSEAASYQAQSENRLMQFQMLYAEWQRQKPKTIKHTDKGKYIITTEEGKTILLKP